MRSTCIACISLAVVLAAALAIDCLAQEVGVVDLTKVTARRELRRPVSAQKANGARGWNTEGQLCGAPTNNSVGALRTTLVSLDRTNYQVGDEPTFEVTVENVDSTPVRIPFSPHLADLQPKNPAQKFAYSELQLMLWIASGMEWSADTGGGVTLYGADDHPDTMLTLNLGEWVRIIGKGQFTQPPAHIPGLGLIHPEAINSAYAQVSMYHAETLLTATAGATVRREVCLRQTYGRSFPITLAGPAQ